METKTERGQASKRKGRNKGKEGKAAAVYFEVEKKKKTTAECEIIERKKRS